MGLREATFITFLLGATSAVAADTKSGAEPAKPAKPAAADPANAAKSPSGDPALEKPPEAAATAQPEPGDGSAAPAGEPAMPPHVVGPKQVDLGHGAAIALPEGFLLFERTEAQELSRQLGNSPDSVVAIIGKPEGDWLIVVHQDDAGFIDDSDADELDADDLLKSLREGTAEQNKKRKEMGKPELLIDGWSEKPRYDRARHHLVWGIAAHTSEGKVINFLTRILGRNGFLSVNLIADPEKLVNAKKEALAILQATQFKSGSRFEDHVSSDRSSGIGLRGLVLGGAGVAVASKLGFLAKLLLGLKKGFVLVVLAIGAVFRRLFRRGADSRESSVVASRTRFAEPPVPSTPAEPDAAAAEPAAPSPASPPPGDPASGGPTSG